MNIKEEIEFQKEFEENKKLRYALYLAKITLDKLKHGMDVVPSAGILYVFATREWLCCA